MPSNTAPVAATYVSIATAADILACSTKTIRRKIASGELPARRIGTRLIRTEAIAARGVDELADADARRLELPRVGVARVRGDEDRFVTRTVFGMSPKLKRWRGRPHGLEQVEHRRPKLIVAN